MTVLWEMQREVPELHCHAHYHCRCPGGGHCHYWTPTFEGRTALSQGQRTEVIALGHMYEKLTIIHPFQIYPACLSFGCSLLPPCLLGDPLRGNMAYISTSICTAPLKICMNIYKLCIHNRLTYLHSHWTRSDLQTHHLHHPEFIGLDR